MKSLFVLILSCVFLVSPQIEAKIWEGCLDAIKRLANQIADPRELSPQEINEILPMMVLKYRETWKNRLSESPESQVGLTMEEAIDLLKSLRSNGWRKSARKIRNETYFTDLGKSQRAVVKQSYVCSDINDGRVFSISTSPRSEVVAFIIDRILGTNMVAPAILLDPRTSAQLHVRGAESSMKKILKDAANALEISLIIFLDYFLHNADRGFPGNILIGEHDKKIAIDFDRSRPHLMVTRESAAHVLRVVGIQLNKGERAVSMPIILPEFVYSNTESMSGSRLMEEAKKIDFEFTDKELRSILLVRAITLEVFKERSQRASYPPLVLPSSIFSEP